VARTVGSKVASLGVDLPCICRTNQPASKVMAFAVFQPNLKIDPPFFFYFDFNLGFRFHHTRLKQNDPDTPDDFSPAAIAILFRKSLYWKSFTTVVVSIEKVISQWRGKSVPWSAASGHWPKEWAVCLYCRRCRPVHAALHPNLPHDVHPGAPVVWNPPYLPHLAAWICLRGRTSFLRRLGGTWHFGEL